MTRDNHPDSSLQFLARHDRLTRRYFMKMGVAASAVVGLTQLGAQGDELPNELQEALAKLEPYFTENDDFTDVSRGKPTPHKLPEEKKREVGLTRETWKLEVTSDPDHPSELRSPLAGETALDWDGLMRLASKHAVRFPKIMTCLNIGRPLGTGIWEGVPLREVVWMTEPKRNVRRVYYHGYHNDDPAQIFRSSLPIDRVLEDLAGLPPVILCYKLNGHYLSGERGGPVRMVVPEGYGFKSVKWLSHIVLTNLYHANDTYANGNNDVSSALKTFAATLSVPSTIKPGQRIPVTGYAQVGVSGLTKVQVWICRKGEEPVGDRYFRSAPWQDASILDPPRHWGGGFPEDSRLPAMASGFDKNSGKPNVWPIRLSKAHWAALLPPLEAGQYSLRCRTVDENGHAQPMPRPFAKSGRTAIERVSITVKA